MAAALRGIESIMVDDSTQNATRSPRIGGMVLARSTDLRRPGLPPPRTLVFLIRSVDTAIRIVFLHSK
ncbi:hypothetical protein WS69_08240 [Burkholderia sp. BDU5]|nr:hypothetical protein WS69_08240 [Burkholderia sp. BDU5]